MPAPLLEGGIVTVLDLFCGAAGGWSLGLHRAGYRTVAASEADPWRRAVFAENNPGVRMYGDVRDLTAGRLVRDLGELPRIVVGSPPCQDASSANAQGLGLDGARTGLFREFIRLVDEIRPLWACAENVPGLGNRGLERIVGALAASGYATWCLDLGAEDAGAPHKRRRLAIVAADAEALQRASLPWRQSDGDHARALADAARVGRGPGRPGRSDPGGPGQRQQPLSIPNAADADGERWLSQRLRDGGDELEELPADPGFRFSEWDHWNGGAPDFGRMDDGLSAALAGRRGLARGCLAAYGDAFVPQFTEAIGRAMARLLPLETAHG